MLKDYLEGFERLRNAEGMQRIILDSYTPKNGTYRVILVKNDTFENQYTLNVKTDKKSNTTTFDDMHDEYSNVKIYDYHSKLLVMNKPVDPTKTIHSNNYLSFAVKKESVPDKLKTETIERYYEILKKPLLKYKTGKSAELYKQIESRIGVPDVELVERIKSYILSGECFQDIDYTEKDYFKIFFVLEDEEKTTKLYEQENTRYLVPNIYNSNDYNLIVNEELIGLPNDNMSMNAKKPFLENKGRKISTPYLLNQEEAILQGQLFDYLYGNAALGRMNAYLSREEGRERFFFFSDKETLQAMRYGYYFRLALGKTGAEICDQDVVVNYSDKMERPFVLRNIIGFSKEDLEKSKLPYNEEIYDLWRLKSLIDNVFFKGYLSTNFYTDVKDIKIDESEQKCCLLDARKALHRWFYLGQSHNVSNVLEQVSMRLILSNVINEDPYTAQRQFNLRWSLIDYFNNDRRMETKMSEVRDKLRQHLNQDEEWTLTDTDEYSYALGQAVAYLIGKSRAAKKPLSLINPFLNAKEVDYLQKRLRQLFIKYNYDLELNSKSRDSKLLTHLFEVTPEEVNQELIIAGFTAKLLIYEKKEENNG